MDQDRIRIRAVENLSGEPHKLKTTAFDLKAHDGQWMEQHRETYQRDDGATILLYNRARRSVLLTRQFRLPVHMHGQTGFLVETVAGLLEGDDPAHRIKEEIKEETGYEVDVVQPLFQAFMSPAAVIEKVYFFAAEYDPARKAGPGGGVKEEGEDLEVLELGFDDAWARFERGEIVDAKTIILLQYAKLRIFA